MKETKEGHHANEVFLFTCMYVQYEYINIDLPIAFIFIHLYSYPTELLPSLQVVAHFSITTSHM